MTGNTKFWNLMYFVSGMIIALLNLVLAFILFSSITSPNDPFGEFPLQQASETVTVGGSVHVTGEKCYTAPTEVIGTVTWRILTPRQAVFLTYQGSAIRSDAKCYQFEFDNQMPDDVALYVGQLLEKGETVTARLEGQETPASGGVTKTWLTSVFTVTP